MKKLIIIEVPESIGNVDVVLKDALSEFISRRDSTEKYVDEQYGNVSGCFRDQVRADANEKKYIARILKNNIKMFNQQD